jgi:hypothetical protein
MTNWHEGVVLLDALPGDAGEFDRATLERMGHPVVMCHGPAPKALCPLLGGLGCPKFERAHGIVFKLDPDGSQHREILYRYRQLAGPDVPIRVLLTPDQAERHVHGSLGLGVCPGANNGEGGPMRQVSALLPAPVPSVLLAAAVLGTCGGDGDTAAPRRGATSSSSTRESTPATTEPEAAVPAEAAEVTRDPVSPPAAPSPRASGDVCDAAAVHDAIARSDAVAPELAFGHLPRVRRRVRLGRDRVWDAGEPRHPACATRLELACGMPGLSEGSRIVVHREERCCNYLTVIHPSADGRGWPPNEEAPDGRFA